MLAGQNLTCGGGLERAVIDASRRRRGKLRSRWHSRRRHRDLDRCRGGPASSHIERGNAGRISDWRVTSSRIRPIEALYAIFKSQHSASAASGYSTTVTMASAAAPCASKLDVI